MGYVGGRLTALLGGVAWPVAYVVLLVLYVLMHYMFVSQSAQVLALFGVFLDVGVRTGAPAPLWRLRYCSPAVLLGRSSRRLAARTSSSSAATT